MKTGMWCHIEIPAKNVKKTQSFYQKVFGWKFQHIPQMGYTIYQTGKGGVGGGIYTPGKGMCKTVLNYILVKDIEATQAKIVRGGGKTYKPKTEVPGVGWFSVVADPEGNTFALWTPARKRARRAGKSTTGRSARKTTARKASRRN